MSISFIDGMTDRLAERIRQIRIDRERKSAGTGLVVLKAEMVKDEMDRQKISLNTIRDLGSRTNRDGYLRGRIAADKIRLDPGVTKDPDSAAIS